MNQVTSSLPFTLNYDGDGVWIESESEKLQVAFIDSWESHREFAEFIVEACNNYYALTGRVKALERALQDTLVVMEHDWPEYKEAQRLLTKDNV